LEQLASKRGHVNHHHAAVGLHRRTVHEAGAFEPGDELRHSRLRLALTRRQVGKPVGPFAFEARHRGRCRE
jgi:hypothetical protein